MFLMKCPDNFPYSQYRGKTVGLDFEWISPWAKSDRTSKAWVVVDPIPGKVVGDYIPKIIWEKLEEEKKRQLRESKSNQKQSKKILKNNHQEEKTKTNSTPKNKGFFNPLRSFVAA